MKTQRVRLEEVGIDALLAVAKTEAGKISSGIEHVSGDLAFRDIFTSRVFAHL